jgi:phage terminase large subunit GpA-like protein
MLSPEASAEPGRWNTSRAEYQREMLDACSDPAYQEVVFCTSAQIGKTEALLNITLFYAHGEPSPMLLVQPTVQMATSFSKDRLAPAIRDTPAVSNLFADAKSRNGNNTVLAKHFPGGVLNLAGANSPASLASRPVRVMLFDEVDRAPLSAGTEGDPVSLAIKRTNNFFNRKIILVSTPTDEATSRIWARYQASDQRKYKIKCVSCSHHFIPYWSLVKWERDSEGEHDAATARLHCPECNHPHNDTERHAAVRNGVWVKHNPKSKIAGFHLSALISPWAELDALVSEWLQAQKDVQRLKTFINTVLGEPFIEQGDSIDDLNIIGRVEEYDTTTIPDQVVVLGAGVDTQNDRLEASIYGRGVDNEFWHIEHQVIHGNPANPQVWKDLESYLKTRFKRSDGYELPVAAACIDSGGHFTQEVYNFCKTHASRRWYAVKGREGSLPIFPARASNTNKGKVYIVGVDSAKETIHEWLKRTEAGPGYVHFSDRCDSEFFNQLASEKKVLKYKNGYTYYRWVKDPNRRNEAFDCFVYALAALESLNISINAHAKKQAKRVEQLTVQSPSEQLKPVSLTKSIDNQPPIEALTKKLPAWKQNILNKTRPGKRWR